MGGDEREEKSTVGGGEGGRVGDVVWLGGAVVGGRCGWKAYLSKIEYGLFEELLVIALQLEGKKASLYNSI